MRPQTGYTLLELTIVLAILATVTAIAWPSLTRPLSRSHVQDAAQQLAGELAGARLTAIEYGRAYEFRYLPGTAWYALRPTGVGMTTTTGESLPRDKSPDGARATVDRDTVAPAHVEAPAAGSPETPDDELSSLPEGITFLDRDVPPPVRTEPPGWDGDSTPVKEYEDADSQPQPTATSDSARWSQPITFHPDGRSSNMQLTLSSRDGHRIHLTVRGLTGTVRLDRAGR